MTAPGRYAARFQAMALSCGMAMVPKACSVLARAGGKADAFAVGRLIGPCLRPQEEIGVLHAQAAGRPLHSGR